MDEPPIRIEMWSSSVMSSYLGAVEMKVAACNGKECNINLVGGAGPNAHSLITGVCEALASANALKVVRLQAPPLRSRPRAKRAP